MFCGKENDNTAAFCAGCGVRIGERQAEKADAGINSKNRKVGIIAIVVIAVVVVAAVVFLFSGRSYKETIDQYFNADSEHDWRSIDELTPQEVVEFSMGEDFDEDEWEDAREEFEDTIREFRKEYYESLVGDDWKTSYEIVGVTDLSDKKVVNLIEIYEDEYDIKLHISAARIVELEVIVEGDDDEITEFREVYLIKIGNSWYLDVESMGWIGYGKT